MSVKYEDMVAGKKYWIHYKDCHYVKDEKGRLHYSNKGENSELSKLNFKELDLLAFTEVIEIPKLTDDEKIILRLLRWKYKYIARDLNGKLYIYNCDEIKKQEDIFIGGDNFLVRVIFEEKFEGIKPMEGYKIEDLLEEN